MSLKESIQYLNERDRRSAQNIYGKIVSRNADGSYNVKRKDTNETVRATRAILGQEYTAGSTVILARDNALNRRVGYAIIGLPGMALQNTGSSPEGEEETEYGQSQAISGSLTVEQGSSGTLTITGVKLVGSPSVADTNLTLSVVSSSQTQIVVTVVADHDATAGNHDVTVGSQTLRNGITVTETDDALYLLSDSAVAGARGCVRVSLSTGNVVWDVAPASMNEVYQACVNGNYVFIQQASANTVGRITKADGTYSEQNPTGYAFWNSRRTAWISDGTYPWLIGDSGTKVYQYDWDTNTILQTVDFGVGITVYDVELVSGYLYYSGISYLKKVAVANGAVTTIDFTPTPGVNGGEQLAWDGTYWYRTQATTYIGKFAMAGGAAVATSGSIGALVRLIYHPFTDALYGALGATVVKINKTTLAVEATSAALARDVYDIQAFGTSIWAGIREDATSMYQLSATDLTTTRTYSTAQAGLYAPQILVRG